jgi:hypothetical protein
VSLICTLFLKRGIQSIFRPGKKNVDRFHGLISEIESMQMGMSVKNYVEVWVM